MNYYLIVDDSGAVIGSQVTKGVINDPRYHLTDNETINKYQLKTRFEGMRFLMVADYPAWATGVAYSVDDVVTYNGDYYIVIQAHTSQAGWTPTAVPALYNLYTPEGVIAPWKQPLGGHDAYALGVKVMHLDKVWESTVASNVWEPSVYGWVESSQFEFIPDGRPTLSFTAVETSPVGQQLSISIQSDTNGEILIEYQTPDNRVGLVMATIQSGSATVNITPTISGYYTLSETDNYAVGANTIIAVYE